MAKSSLATQVSCAFGKRRARHASPLVDSWRGLGDVVAGMERQGYGRFPHALPGGLAGDFPALRPPDARVGRPGAQLPPDAVGGGAARCLDCARSGPRWLGAWPRPDGHSGLSAVRANSCLDDDTPHQPQRYRSLLDLWSLHRKPLSQAGMTEGSRGRFSRKA
jgi:hypothetical protein